MMRGFLLGGYRLVRGVLFRVADAQTAHEQILKIMAWCDNRAWIQAILGRIRRAAFKPQPCEVGGVSLPYPAILAAGFVKGAGFAHEDDALAAVARGENIIQGWRTVISCVGVVEFGSYTRYPRLGNSGMVIWRDAATFSTQNRVGLRNPGIRAAALFLSAQQPQGIFGLNIAVSPGVESPEQERAELLESFEIALSAGVRPAWFTLNLSCPNTDDDPQGHQSEAKAESLCRALIEHLAPYAIPLWVKLGPDLSAAQYQKLMLAFAGCGVRAVIATNTLGQPIAGTDLTGGVAGGRLHPLALDVVRQLAAVKQQHGLKLDIIGCGGARDAATYRAFREAGAAAVQYYSGMIYAGPWVAADFVR